MFVKYIFFSFSTEYILFLCVQEMAAIFIILAFIVDVVYCQLVSPCPRIFNYETKAGENDRWYGDMTLASDSDLTGLWLRIILNKQSIQLGVSTPTRKY